MRRSAHDAALGAIKGTALQRQDRSLECAERDGAQIIGLLEQAMVAQIPRCWRVGSLPKQATGEPHMPGANDVICAEVARGRAHDAVLAY